MNVTKQTIVYLLVRVYLIIKEKKFDRLDVFSFLSFHRAHWAVNVYQKLCMSRLWTLRIIIIRATRGRHSAIHCIRFYEA